MNPNDFRLKNNDENVPLLEDDHCPANLCVPELPLQMLSGPLCDSAHEVAQYPHCAMPKPHQDGEGRSADVDIATPSRTDLTHLKENYSRTGSNVM